MRRRAVVTLLGGAGAAALLRPRAVRAQQSPPVIGFIRDGKFELAINLKTANALGLTVPAAIFGGAEVVIE
jgi:hypothetical protein